MGIFSKKPTASKIHATKAGRFLADIERDSRKQNDELAKRRDQKNGGRK